MQNVEIYHLEGVDKSTLQSKGEIIIVVSDDQFINIDNNNQGITMNM